MASTTPRICSGGGVLAHHHEHAEPPSRPAAPRSPDSSEDTRCYDAPLLAVIPRRSGWPSACCGRRASPTSRPRSPRAESGATASGAPSARSTSSCSGIGAVIGAGIFSSIGTAAVGEVAPDGTVTRYGAGPALVLSFVLLGGGLRPGRPLLRGADRPHPHLGQRLHLRLRHPGRARGLDHRLGPDPRVRGRQRGGGHRLVRLLLLVPARRFGIGHAVLALPQLPRRGLLAIPERLAELPLLSSATASPSTSPAS